MSNSNAKFLSITFQKQLDSFTNSLIKSKYQANQERIEFSQCVKALSVHNTKLMKLIDKILLMNSIILKTEKKSNEILQRNSYDLVNNEDFKEKLFQYVFGISYIKQEKIIIDKITKLFIQYINDWPIETYDQISAMFQFFLNYASLIGISIDNLSKSLSKEQNKFINAYKDIKELKFSIKKGKETFVELQKDSYLREWHRLFI